MNRARKLIFADELHRRGITGKGVTAVIMDSGISPHPDYIDRVILFQDFVNDRRELYDDSSHGTHVTGILGGNGKMSGGKYCGIAPECNLIHLKILDKNGNGKISDTLAALEWVINHRKTYNIKVLNFSVGSCLESAKDSQLLSARMEQVWDAGITVVVAAGNMGPAGGSITVPGTSRKVITVGFYDDGYAAGTRHFFSGRGPTGDCILKPEITAPGYRIVSCGGRAANNQSNNQYYTVKSGSSMATPMISGAVCLLLSQYPKMTNVEVKMKLKDAADDLGMDRSRQGWGRINLMKLLPEE